MERILSLIGLEDVVTSPAATETTTTGLSSMNSFMAIMMIAIGVFALYSALTGKGPAFKNDYPASMQADAHKMLQKFLWIIGPVTLVTGVLDFLGYTWAYWASVAIVIPAIIVYIIIFRKRFKEDLKRMR